MVSDKFFNIPYDFASAAIATVSVQKDYLRVILLTIEATPLIYNTIFNDRTSKNTQETLMY